MRLPDEAAALTDAQRSYLTALADATAGGAPASGEAWQALIFSTAKENGLAAGDAFRAVYLAFLGPLQRPASRLAGGVARRRRSSASACASASCHECASNERRRPAAA